MRATFLCTALLAGLALPATASEGVDLSIKSKSMAASSTEMLSKSAPAPFLRHARDPRPELVMRAEEERRGPAGAEQALRSRAAVRMVARKLMNERLS